MVLIGSGDASAPTRSFPWVPAQAVWSEKEGRLRAKYGSCIHRSALWTGLSLAREKPVWLAGCLRGVDPLCITLPPPLHQWPAPQQAPGERPWKQRALHSLEPLYFTVLSRAPRGGATLPLSSAVLLSSSTVSVHLGLIWPWENLQGLCVGTLCAGGTGEDHASGRVWGPELADEGCPVCAAGFAENVPSLTVVANRKACLAS